MEAEQFVRVPIVKSSFEGIVSHLWRAPLGLAILEEAFENGREVLGQDVCLDLAVERVKLLILLIFLAPSLLPTVALIGLDIQGIIGTIPKSVCIISSMAFLRNYKLHSRS